MHLLRNGVWQALARCAALYPLSSVHRLIFNMHLVYFSFVSATLIASSCASGSDEHDVLVLNHTPFFATVCTVLERMEPQLVRDPLCDLLDPSDVNASVYDPKVLFGFWEATQRTWLDILEETKTMLQRAEAAGRVLLPSTSSVSPASSPRPPPFRFGRVTRSHCASSFAGRHHGTLETWRIHKALASLVCFSSIELCIVLGVSADERIQLLFVR
jgi:hypothetical protein